MIITPVLWTKNNVPALYSTERVVYTNIDGERVAVSQTPYLGRTKTEVITQALGNIKVKHLRHALSCKYNVNR